jgi:hypothetical protein
VFHVEEVFYIWMQESLWQNNNYISAADYTIANFFGQTWTDFAKYGYGDMYQYLINGENSIPIPIVAPNYIFFRKVSWNPVTFDSPYQYMEIGLNVTQKPSYRETARVFWNEVVPAIVGEYPKPAPSNGPQSPISSRSTMSITTTSRPTPKSLLHIAP